MASVSRTTTIYGAGANRVDLYMKVSESAVDASTNTSRLTVYLALKCYGYSGVVYQISDAYVSIGGTKVGRKTSGSRTMTDGDTWYIVNGVSYTVNHNADGTGSVSCYGYFNTYSTSSATLTLTPVPKAGTAAISPASASIATKNGSTIDTITVTPKDSNYFHRVSAVLNGSTVLSARWAEDYSYTMTITDQTLLTALGDNSTGTLTVTVKTYATKSTSGTLIGTTTADATVSVNTSSIKPTLTSISTAADSTPITGYIVAGYSTAKINFTPTPGYGANSCTTTIALNKGTMATNSSTATSATSLSTSIVPSDSSDYTITATLTVTDGRGASATATATISVKGYKAPNANINAYRVASNGSNARNEAGEWAYCRWNCSVTSIGSNAIQSESITYSGDISGSFSSPSPGWVALALNQGATFTYTVSDLVTTKTVRISVSLALFPIDLYQAGGGNVGAAFGGVAVAGLVRSFLPFAAQLPVVLEENSSATLDTRSGIVTRAHYNGAQTLTIPDGTENGWYAVIVRSRSNSTTFTCSGSDGLVIRGQTAIQTSYTLSGLGTYIIIRVAGTRLALCSI